jgi:serine phosphatase RsbU (regulator of sigma subunit)
LYKRDVRAAIGWVGLIWFSPFVGAFLYLFFGINRLRELIRRCANLSAAQISKRISIELEEFRGGSKQSDDIAFVVIKVL